MSIKKIISILKEILEWIVAVALLLSGYLVYRYIKDRFFGSSSAEKEILAEIEENKQKIKELEEEAKGNVEKEKELQKEQEKIQEKIDKLKEEYYKKQEEFAQKEQEISNTTHEENINYLNQKYRKE